MVSFLMLTVKLLATSFRIAFFTRVNWIGKFCQLTKKEKS